MDSQLIDCLLNAKNSTEAIQALYQHHKNHNQKFSLAYLQRRSGISSRGYVSDIVSGRRVVHVKYLERLPQAFDLEGAAAEYLQQLIHLDHLAGATEEDTTPYRERLAQLRKLLHVGRQRLPEHYKERQFFSFEVFCAFSLFHNRPTKANLVTYFGRDRAIDIDYALQDLMRLEVIAREDDHYKPRQDFVVFSDSENGLSHIEFLKISLGQALKQLDKWFAKKDEAVIHSSMITVNREEYLKRIPKIKETLYEMQTNLETSHGNAIIRFNVQIFPSGGAGET